MKTSNSRYCLVCGYDFNKDNQTVEYQSLCPCCFFHYGIDEVGNNEAFYFYRIKWLKEKWDIDFLNKAHIFSKQDLISQFTNIAKINPDNYFFGQNKDITHNFDKFNIEIVNEKWEMEFGAI